MSTHPTSKPPSSGTKPTMSKSQQQNSPPHPATTPLTCPLPHCSWHSLPTQAQTSADQLRIHLQQAHADKPTTFLTDKLCQKHDVHPCRICNDSKAIYFSNRHLQAHINRAHSRSDTNSDIVRHTLRHLSPQQIHLWNEQLAFLHSLELTPPPFRRSTFTKLKPQARNLFLQTLHTVTKWTVTASQPFTRSTSSTALPPSSQTDSTPFWKLLILLEALLLAPIKHTQHRTYHNALKARIAKLKQGNLIALYQSIWHPQTQPRTSHNQRTNKHKHHSPTTTPTKPTPATMAPYAQDAADIGNLRAATNRLTAAMPVATLTTHRINIVTNTLYPKRLDPPRQTRQQQYIPQHQTSLTDHDLEHALHKLSQGTAPGPYADSIDCIRAMGLHRSTSHPQSNRPYFQTIKDVFDLILNNNVPTTVRPLIASIHFFALHKDFNNLDKLRPIGIGTSLRRTAATIALTTISTDIEPLLHQHGQYGIQTGGGVDFAVHMTQAQIDQFISTTTPTRALLLLDLTNMFNACSRTKCREILTSHPETQPLLPLFDLLYSNTTKNWYQDPKGNNATIQQEEGFSQGCPLSPLFACLVLLTLTNQLNNILQQRANTRLNNNDPRDDDKGGISHTASVMDDTSICLSYPDILPFLRDFETLGPPYGIHLNQQKCKLLTATTGTSPLGTLNPTDKQHLQSALEFLNPHCPTDAKITEGIRFLGQPIGSTNFITQLINDKLLQAEEKALAIRALPDSQTQSLLFRTCLLPTLSHLMATDILLRMKLHPTSSPPSPTSTPLLWSSPFTAKIDEITTSFLQHLTHAQTVPIHSLLIAHLNSSLGGLGYRCHRSSAIPTLLNTIARTLKLATTNAIPPAHSHTFAQKSHQHYTFLSSVHQHFASHFPTSTLPFDPCNPLSYPPDAQKQLTTYTQEQQLLPLIVESTPAIIQRSLPSALSPWTSLPLHQPRSMRQFRLTNNLFQIAIARKTRLPFLPQHYPDHCHCSRKAPLDAYGDHLFSCAKQHKTKLSNKLRDALFFILQDTAPRAKWIRNESDVHLEPTNLLPHHPRNIRPANIGLALQPPLPNNRFHYVAIDVTIPAPHPHQPPSPLTNEQQRHGDLPFHQIASDASEVHHSAARNKFTHDTTTTALINTNDLLLLPLTVDHLGGIRHFGHTLLFGPAPHYSFTPSLPPPWTTPQLGRANHCIAHPDAFLAYNNLSQHGPSCLLPTAQRSLPSPTPNQLTLSHYTTLTLGHAITSALAQHVLDAFTSFDAHLSQHRKLQRLQRSSVFDVCPTHRYTPHPFNPHTLYSVPDNPTPYTYTLP